MNKSTPEKAKERDTFKNSGGLFPVMYGCTANKVAATSKITEQEGQQMINVVKGCAPKIVTTLDGKSKEASTLGYVIHNSRTGSRRWFTPVLDHIKYGFPLSKSDKIDAEMEARNSPVQGTNSDLMKEAIAMLELWITLFRQDVRFLLTVHDELVVDCPEEQADFYASKVKEIMKRAAKNYLIKEIDMDVDVRVAKHWKK